MKIKEILPVALAALALAGCNKGPSEEIKTVDWYLAHPKEMKKKLKECSNNPGELMNTPNCKNATSADAKSLTRPPTPFKFKDLN